MENIEEERARVHIQYAVLLFVSAFFVAVEIYRRDSATLVFSLPLLVLSIIYLGAPKKQIPISPKMCSILVVMMALSHFIDLFFDMYPDFGPPSLIEAGALLTDLIFGLLLALVSIIGIMNLLRYAPELANGRPVFVTISAFCVSATMCELLRFGSVAIDLFWAPEQMVNVFGLISGLLGSLIGSAITCLLFFFNSKIGFMGPAFDRLVSADLPPTDSPLDMEMSRNSIRELIEQGESDKLEFKSTLRTNLVTNEKDPRMEKAVLKTIVAFLNTRGGVLLIGVSDSGQIVGADEGSFDSRDRMLLHLNHLIEDRIGKEFIAFIRYFVVDFDGLPVIRVNCRRSDSPVFLTEGKEQTFFVRSGPSSIDLHGMDLLKYANHNFKKTLRLSSD